MASHSSRNRAIDGLRALAVLSVFAFHISDRFLPAGFLGVDVFFVISGYVVTKSLSLSKETNLFKLLISFYSRRILRIYPALVFCLLVTGIFSRMFVPVSYLQANSTLTGAWAFWGLSNISMAYSENSYFGVLSEFNPYTHTWSLGVEEQYYLIFPFLYFFLQPRENRSSVVTKFFAIGLLFAPIVCSYWYCSWQSIHAPDLAFYLLPSRFWELGVGVVLALLHQRRILLPSGTWQAYISATVGLLAIVLSMFVLTGWDFPAPGALTAVLGALSFISGVADDRITHPVKRFFGRSFLVYVGSISYSLYLWHWPVIVLFKWTCGMESALTISLAILVAILLAVFSYHAIEKPFLATTALKHSTLDFGFSIGSSTERMHRFSRSFSFGVVVLAVGICSIAGANRLYHRISKSMTLSLSVTEHDPFGTGPWHHFDRDFPTKPWHNRKLFIIGDSHAGCYGKLASLLRKETGLDAIVHSEGGVEFASLMRPPGKRDLDFGSRVLDDLKKRAKPGDAVLLSSLRVERFCNQWILYDIADVIAKRDSAEAESRRRLGVESGVELITQLQVLGLEVVIECPKPILLSPPFRCSDWFNSMNPIGARGFTVERDILLEHRAPAMKSIHEVASRLPSVRIWDPMDVLCPGENFNGFDGSKPIFFDGDHLSAYGNQKLYLSLKNVLDQIWNEG
jgi:peptidoglycan/LPS O-acetylase OafA/YrhL